MKLFKDKIYSPVSAFSLALITGIVLLASCNTKPKTGTGTDDGGMLSGKQMYSDSASSMVRVFDQEGKVCIQKSNTYYELVDAYTGQDKTPLLLKIKKTELCFADSVNNRKVYEIAAKSILDTKNINWNTQFVATDLQFNANCILATTEGGDNEEDFMTRYSLMDGKEIFSASFGELRVTIPNSKDKRFIGFVSRKAASAPLKQLNEENLLGLVRYSSNSKAMGNLKLRLKRSAMAGKIPSSTPDMILVPVNENVTPLGEGKEIVLRGASEPYQSADITGFALKITFYYGDDNEATNIIIPVVNDNFDLSNAKYDKEIFELTTD